MSDGQGDRARPTLLALQRRICSAPYEIDCTASGLYKRLQSELLAAHRDEKLKTSPHEVRKYLKMVRSDTGNAHEIYGGVKDNKRRAATGLFERDDGALFNFKLTVIEVDRKLTLRSYAFELQPPEGIQPPFIRFDLNHNDHPNDHRGMRCHLHPGNDDIQVPSPLMTPIELLQLFLYRTRLPTKQRS